MVLIRLRGQAILVPQNSPWTHFSALTILNA